MVLKRHKDTESDDCVASLHSHADREYSLYDGLHYEPTSKRGVTDLDIEIMGNKFKVYGQHIL
jgi:hypothetical protein